MTRIRQALGSTILSIAMSAQLGLAPTPVAAGDEQARKNTVVTARYAKTPDLSAYCQRHYGAEARLRGYSALDWHCWKGAGRTWGISVTQACKEQHNLGKAAYSDKWNPYSWYCTQADDKKRVDLSAYCKRHHNARALLTQKTVYGWKCIGKPNHSWGISVARACLDQHGLPKASFTHQNDPQSWYCHR